MVDSSFPAVVHGRVIGIPRSAVRLDSERVDSGPDERSVDR
jgi:hypothetical protein